VFDSNKLVSRMYYQEHTHLELESTRRKLDELRGVRDEDEKKRFSSLLSRSRQIRG